MRWKIVFFYGDGAVAGRILPSTRWQDLTLCFLRFSGGLTSEHFLLFFPPGHQCLPIRGSAGIVFKVINLRECVESATRIFIFLVLAVSAQSERQKTRRSDCMDPMDSKSTRSKNLLSFWHKIEKNVLAGSFFQFWGRNTTFLSMLYVNAERYILV